MFAQPDHDRDRSYERKALTEPGGESNGISDAEVASLIGHEHPAVPEPIEDTVHVDGTLERRVTPRVGAAYQPCPVRIPFRTYGLEGREPGGRGFGMKFFLGELLFPIVPVAFVDELRAAITVELEDISLRRENPGPILGQSSGAVDDKGWRYLYWLRLSTSQVEELCSNSNEGM